MFVVHLEERFRAAVGMKRGSPREDSVAFAVEFTQLLARWLTDEEVQLTEVRRVMLNNIRARTELEIQEIDLLLELALVPEARAAISESDIRAFESRFGSAEGVALQQAADAEADLEGFANRHGAEEALLLLDAMFRISAVDGRIDRDEIARLTRASEELGIDAKLLSALFRMHDPRHATGELFLDLVKDRYVIGREPHLDVPLPDPQIASRHCELVKEGDGWRLLDLGSGRPTLLDGQAIKSAPMAPGQTLRVGSYSLVLGPEAKSLQVFGPKSFSALSVRNLKRKIGSVTLLDDVSFTVFSGEVVAIVGPSGAGKTTLLNAITGVAPADSGTVLFEGQNFHRLLGWDPSMVGIVPQDDVVHPELTVEESLYFSGRLRFPRGTGRKDVRAEVDRVLEELDITKIRKSRIGDAVRRGVSGGQRKRVNLGQELLTRSNRVLFLDEPTSGLDPQTSSDIVGLTRQLADGGRIVFLVTHDMSPAILQKVDHLMVLAPGGRLAWFGPPDEASRWFGVDSPEEVFSKLPEKTPEQWGAHYRQGPAFRKFVRSREHLLGLDGIKDVAGSVPRPRRGGVIRQLFTLTHRTFTVKRRDWAGLFVLMAQAPVLGVFMWIVFPAPDAAAMFMLALSSLWFGASASVRELIAERSIWRREARVGVRTLPYLASKVWVLGTFVGVQCTVLATMCFIGLPLYGEYGYSWFLLTLVTVLTGWIGMAIGLCISAFLSSSEAAVGTLPLILIPQITFSGLLVKVKEMGLLAKVLSYTMVVRYGFEAMIKCGDKLTEPARGGLERQAKPLGGILYNLGFKSTASASDMGLPLWFLIGLLVCLFVGLLFIALVQTWRTRH